ncbi:MAG: methionine ABC transporter permease [Eubacteriales bacterium]|nr:methionine ABC transporter permease [Eubacteriales bacterium]
MNDLWPSLWQASLESLYMVFASTLFAILLGLPLGVLLYRSQQAELNPRPKLYRILDFFVNLFRSLPFAILILLLLPMTKILIGRQTGTSATIVPLVIASVPFMARITEQSFLDLDRGVLEAALAMGISKTKILWRVLLREALPNLIASLTLMMISIFGYSAMAGTIGGGGLGDLALRFGYYRKDLAALWAAVISSVIIVQLIQLTGNSLVRFFDHR